MLERAVEWGRIPTNPVRVVKKPKQIRTRVPRPLAPEVVEKLRGKLHQRDATLVSVLAYSGLRPGEALALTWDDVQKQTLIVEKALAGGKTKATKTGQTRSVRLLKPLVSDLNEWRMASGRPAGTQPIFPMKDGRYWTATALRNWRRKVFVPAAKAAGIKTRRPYDLRHSFASLLFQEGTNPARSRWATRSRRSLAPTRT
jgi:integrase